MYLVEYYTKGEEFDWERGEWDISIDHIASFLVEATDVDSAASIGEKLFLEDECLEEIDIHDLECRVNEI